MCQTQLGSKINATFAGKKHLCMGNFSRQQEEKKEAKENDRLSREALGKYFYDLAKVTFTAMVVGSTIAWISDVTKDYHWKLLSIGVVTTILLTYIGYKIIKKIELWMDFLLF